MQSTSATETTPKIPDEPTDAVERAMGQLLAWGINVARSAFLVVDESGRQSL